MTDLSPLKPPSLAEEALNQLDTIHIELRDAQRLADRRYCMGFNTDTIRRALEKLQELENNQ